MHHKISLCEYIVLIVLYLPSARIEQLISQGMATLMSATAVKLNPEQ